MSIYDKSHLVKWFCRIQMGSLSVYPWQRIWLLPENDVTALDDMKSRVHNGLKS